MITHTFQPVHSLKDYITPTFADHHTLPDNMSPRTDPIRFVSDLLTHNPVFPPDVEPKLTKRRQDSQCEFSSSELSETSHIPEDTEHHSDLAAPKMIRIPRNRPPTGPVPNPANQTLFANCSHIGQAIDPTLRSVSRLMSNNYVTALYWTGIISLQFLHGREAVVTIPALCHKSGKLTQGGNCPGFVGLIRGSRWSPQRFTILAFALGGGGAPKNGIWNARLPV